MNTALEIFRYQEKDIRTAIIDGEPWFVAKDVCDFFGDTHHHRALNKLSDDEKGVSPLASPGGIQQTAIINESGLYKLFFSMHPQKRATVSEEQYERRKEAINKFQRWVTHEVIPAIRKRGYYYNYPVAGGIDQSAGLVLGLARHLVTLEQRIDKLEERDKRVAVIQAPVKPVSTRVRIVQLIRGYVEANQKSYTEVWQKLYEEFKMRYHCDLSQRTANSRNKSGLDIAEKLGMIEDLYTLAKFLFVETN